MSIPYGELGEQGQQQEEQARKVELSSEKALEQHRNIPVDTRADDIHHTLGIGSTQAARGSHVHDGADSLLLLDGFIITGSVADPSTVLPSIIDTLVRLGATDNTT